jgi:hypothetical protein
MKLPFDYKWIIVAVLAVLLLLKISCDGDGEESTTIETKNVDYTIPQQTGKFDSPTTSEEIKNYQRDSIIYLDRILYVEGKANDSIIALYKAAKNDNDRMQVLLNSTKERNYVNTFEDDYVKIESKTKVEGVLKDEQLSYVRKETTVQVPQTTITHNKTLESKFSLFAGARVESAKDLQKIVPGAEVGIQINGNTMLSGSYNTEGTIGIGLKFRIFNINK